MPKYFNNPETFKKATDIIKKRHELYYDVYDKVVTHKEFDNIETSNKNFDKRDLLNMSYLISLNKPDITDEEYKAEVEKLLRAFMPTYTKEELAKIKEDLKEEAKKAYEDKLAHIEDKKKKAEEYAKTDYYIPERLNKLLNETKPEYLKNQLDEALAYLDKDEFNYEDIFDFNKKFSIAGKYVGSIRRNNYLRILKTAGPYIDNLDNLKLEVINNLNNYDTNKLDDCYKLIAFSYQAQTSEVKAQEFKTYLEKSYKSIEEFKKIEAINVKICKINVDMCHDYIDYDFHMNDYTKISMGNYSQALQSRSAKVGKLDEALSKIASSKYDGKIEFDMPSEAYEVRSKTESYFKNHNEGILEKQGSTLKDTFGGLISEFATRGTTDIEVQRTAKIELIDRIYIDGKALSAQDELKDEPKDRDFSKKAYMLLAKKMFEGNHYIAATRYTNFKGKASMDIIPVHVNHDKDAYLKSKGFFFRLFHPFINVQKRFDDRFKVSEDNVAKYNDMIKEDFKHIKTAFEENYEAELSDDVKELNKAVRKELNVDLSDKVVVNDKVEIIEDNSKELNQIIK